MKSTVIFRGREMAHNEIGRRILKRLAAELAEVALIEVAPRQEGMTMVQILAPKKEAPAKAAEAEEVGRGRSQGREGPEGPEGAKPPRWRRRWGRRRQRAENEEAEERS